MAWTMEPILSNTGSVISSIYRNWEDFSLNWDSLSPNEDSELVGASSSELIAFGYEFNNIHSHWDATNNDWDAYQFLYASEGEDSSMVSTSPKFTSHVWHKYIYNWNLVELSWSDSFSFRKEKETTYIDSYFHRIPIKFNRWNSYFSSSSWVNENLASNIISSSDMWDGNDTLWNKNAVTWDSFHPPGAEVYTGPFLSVTRMDYSYGLWEGFVEKWNTAGNSWDDFSNQLEDVPTNQYHALVFDGVNNHAIVNNIDYDLNDGGTVNAVTMSGWAKPDFIATPDVTDYGTGDYIISGTNQTGISAMYFNIPNAIHSYMQNALRVIGLFGGTSVGGNEIDHYRPYDNEEHFIVATLNATAIEGRYRARIFVDGEVANVKQNLAVSESSFYKDINVNESLAHLLDIKIGQDRAEATRRYYGKMRDVAIWNIDLSAEDIEKLYNNGNPANLMNNNSYDNTATNRKDNLIGWWKMGEGLTTGDHTTVLDSSSNNNHANLIGFDSNPYISTHLTTTSNISPIYDYTHLGDNWDALNRNWDDFFLGVE